MCKFLSALRVMILPKINWMKSTTCKHIQKPLRHRTTNWTHQQRQQPTNWPHWNQSAHWSRWCWPSETGCRWATQTVNKVLPAPRLVKIQKKNKFIAKSADNKFAKKPLSDTCRGRARHMIVGPHKFNVGCAASSMLGARGIIDGMWPTTFL